MAIWQSKKWTRREHLEQNENENNNSIKTTHVSSNVGVSFGILITYSSYFLDHKKRKVKESKYFDEESESPWE